MENAYGNSRKIPTPEARALYHALVKLGIPAELEKYDGYKTIDIAITRAKVNIEVDGPQHKNNANQALADLKRTIYSFQKDYVTLRIPYCLINEHLEEAAPLIAKFIWESMDQLRFG